MRHERLPGVEVFSFGDGPKKGEPQEVLVVVEPNGIIPSHSHSVDAHMYVVAGSAEVLSDDPEIGGKRVSRGSCVLFERTIPHGFRAGPEGLSFVSRNGGIVDETAAWDMQMVG